MKPIVYKPLRLNRRFGIEIELGNTVPKSRVVKAIQNCSNCKVQSFKFRKSLNNKIWHVKNDGTCGVEGDDNFEDGWEVASFVAHAAQDINHMGTVATALKEAGAEVNTNCGYHIHAEVADFTMYQMGTLIAHWLKFESILKEIIPETRNFFYCQPLSEVMVDAIGPDYHIIKFTSLELYNLFLPAVGDDPNDLRYRALNIINYYLSLKYKRFKRKTLELRFPESTLEADDIVGWLRLFLNFIEFVKNAPMPENLYIADVAEALELLGLSHAYGMFCIFGATLNKTRIWLLNKIIERAKSQRLKFQAKKILKTIRI